MATRKKPPPPKPQPRPREKAPARRKPGQQEGQRKKQFRQWKQPFLDALKEDGAVTHACMKARVPRSRPYAERKRDPEFASAWDEIVNRVLDEVEESVVKRAREGWLETVWHGGKPVGQVRKFDTTLQIFVLRQRRPEAWARAERMKIEHEGMLGMASIKVTDEEAARQCALLLARAAARRAEAEEK